MSEPLIPPEAPDDDPTLLDPGRHRPEDDDITDLDPGRRRPGPGALGELPPGLRARFIVVRPLSGPDAPDPVLLVTERATEDYYIVKLYSNTPPDQRVWQFLTGPHGRGIVSVLETGTDAGIAYELMEYVAGASLTDLRVANRGGLDRETLEQLVRHIVDALTELHEHGIVHHDIKPSNIRLRNASGHELALVDFAISRHVPVPPGELITDDESGTTRFMPPEFITGRLVTPAYDWWSLGITVMELATGTPVHARLTNQRLRIRYGAGPLSVAAVMDERIRLLCMGLLAQSRSDRWGARQVEAWLVGESPQVPSTIAAPGTTVPEVPEPYLYQGFEYRRRDELALAMTASWDVAARLLYDGGRQERLRLERWLDQYPDRPGRAARGRSGDSPHVRLLRLLRAMAPTLPPVFRGRSICRETLPGLAGTAIGTSDAALFALAVIRDLAQTDVLALLQPGQPTVDLGGGEGLDEINGRWRVERDRWGSAIQSVRGEAAEQLRPADRHDRQREDDRVLAYTLVAATASDERREEIRERLRVVDRLVPGVDGTVEPLLPWFHDLLDRPDGLWVAYRLRAYAEADGRRVASARRLTNRYRREIEWSRRQNRPLALAWAAAGVALLGVLCAAGVSVSDLTNVAPDATIMDAWLMTVMTLCVTLALEALLAWEIGGRFHPRYSLLGAGSIVLGRGARSIQGRGLSLVVVVGVVGGGFGLAVLAPIVPPALAGGLVIVWTAMRFIRWRRYRAQVEAQARMAPQAQPGAAA